MVKSKSVLGIFLNQKQVEVGVSALKDGGFLGSDISLLLPENLLVKDFTTEITSKAPEGASVGAGSGALLGSALGWLVGIGALGIPGLGPFIAAGPIMTALAGIGLGGAVGGFAGALVGLGIPEYEAKRYERRLRTGGILLSVHCESTEEVERAKRILERAGAEDVSSAGENTVRVDSFSHEASSKRVSSSS